MGSSSCEALESEKMNIGSQRILFSDHINACQYSSEKVDSFVIDMDSFSSSINKDNINANSRTTVRTFYLFIFIYILVCDDYFTFILFGPSHEQNRVPTIIFYYVNLNKILNILL